MIWDDTFNLPLAVHKEGLSTYYTYDQSGNVLEKKDTDRSSGESRVWTYTYNAQNLIETIDGPRTDVSDVKIYTYNGDGTVASISNALFTETTFLSYDIFGRPLQQLDANSALTEFTYDTRGRLTQQQTGSEALVFEYDNSGRVIRVVTPDGSEILSVYDDADHLVETTDELGNKTQYTFDANGNKKSIITQDSSQTIQYQYTWSYDGLGRMTGESNAQGQETTYSYDNYGNRLSSLNAKSQLTSFTYDALNQVEAISYPDAGLVTNVYDDAGNLSGVTDPMGNQTLYSYNGFGQQTTVQSSDTGQSSAAFDSAGNLTSSWLADGSSVTHQYDVLNRLTQSTYSDGEVITYVYDSCLNGVGRLCAASTPNSTVLFKYDTHDRVVEKTQQMGAISLTTTATYNANGQQTALTYPSGKILTYEYTGSKLTGLLFDGVPIIANINYNALGLVTSWTWGNGSQHIRTYDQDGRLVGQDLGNGSRTLLYDPIGNITDLLGVGGNQQFDYDAMQRLIAANANEFNIGIVYDANGNRLSLTESATGMENYSYDLLSNRLENVTGTQNRSYAYDQRGNTLSDGIHTFTYNARNRLVGVDNNVVTYQYNAPGQRVTKINDGITTHYIFGDSGNLLGEYNQTGQATRETIYFNNTPIVVINSDGIFNIHSDHLNTPRYITNQQDTVVWDWNGKPFGETPANEDPDDDSIPFEFYLRFPGQYYDHETGLHYNYFRTYDPSTGRYLESDPIGLQGGLNTYLYVKANPLMFIDPQGLVIIDDYDGVRIMCPDAANGCTFLFGYLERTEPYSNCYKIKVVDPDTGRSSIKEVCTHLGPAACKATCLYKCDSCQGVKNVRKHTDQCFFKHGPLT